MFTMRILMLLVMLIICSIDDYYHKKINIVTVVIISAAALLLNFDTNISTCLAGLIPGAVLYVVSKLKLQIGEGDGIVFMMLGINTGVRAVIEIITISFALSFFYSIYLIIKRKKNRKYTFAFMPFILAAFCMEIMKNKYKAGSMTIELSLIMPGIMAVLILVIFLCYFLHDKCVIRRAAYVSCLREADSSDLDYDEGRIYSYFEGLIEGRLLGSWQLDTQAQIDNDKVIMSVSGNMSSPAGILNKYVKTKLFSFGLEAYSYIKPDY